MEKRRKNRIILSHRYSDTRFRRKKTGSSQWKEPIHRLRKNERVFRYNESQKV